MSRLTALTQPGPVLGFVLLGMLALLAIRLADEHAKRPRNHLIIAGGALLAFGIVYRLADVWHLAAAGVQPRWSSVVIAGCALVFVAADQRLAARYRRLWERRPRYTGPERRRPPRVGTDHDEDFPRDGSP